MELDKYKITLDKLKAHLKVTSDAEVARSLGVTPQALSSFKKAGKFPSDLLITFCLNHKLSLDWLLSGTKSNIEPIDTKLVEVDVFSLAGAGGPMALTAPEPLADRVYVSADWHRPSVVAVKVRGRSMEPGIIDGAVVGIDTEDRQVISGKVYAVWIDYEGAVIKRLYAEPGRLVLKSDNPEFEPVYITNGDGIVLGKLRWSVQEY